MTTVPTEPVGVLIRRWRERRRRSQLEVSAAAAVSTRHLSFVETGRSTPSRTMIERLCDELEVPLRERNALYLAAGFAPVHRERQLPDLGAALAAVRSMLAGLEPNPSVAVDVLWQPVAVNHAMARFLGGVPAALTEPPLNMLRMTLHPDGLAPAVANLAEWRHNVLRRVRRQIERTAAPGLAELLAELESYPAPAPAVSELSAANDLVTPLRISTEYGELSFLYTMTVFGSPRDVTLDEIAVESFFPADAHTADALRQPADPAPTLGPLRDLLAGEA